MPLLGLPAEHRTKVTYHTAAWLLFGVFQGGLIAFLPIIAKRLGGSNTLVAILISAPFVASIIAPAYVNRLSQLRAVTLMAYPRILSAIVFVLIAACVSPYVFVIVASTGWFVFYASQPFYGEVLKQIYPSEARGRLLVFPMIGLTAGRVLANLVIGRLLDLSAPAYRTVLPATAVFGILSAVILLRIPVPPAERVPAGRGLIDCFKVGLGNKKFLIWSTVYAVVAIGFWIFFAALPDFYVHTLGLENDQVGATRAAMNILMIIGYPFWGRFLDRHGVIPTMLVGWTIAAAGILITALGGGYYSAVIGQGLHGFGIAGNEICWFPVVLQYAPPDRVKSYAGFYLTVYGIRGMIGVYLVPLLTEGVGLTSQTSIVIAVAVIMLGLGLMFGLRRRMTP